MSIRKLVSQLGAVGTILTVTLLSTAMSVLVTLIAVYCARYIKPEISYFLSLMIAIVVPMVVGPLALWHLVHLTIKIHGLEEEMRYAANHDALTSLLNRHAFLEELQRILQQPCEAPLNYCVILIDLDFFKKINDQYGHVAGDKVLASFGGMISRLLRRHDLIGRLGGEEFGVFLQGITMQQAIDLAERVRQALANSAVAYEKQTIRYTVSIGGVVFRSDGQDLEAESVVAEADQALYLAKEGGRNCSHIVERST